MQEQPDVVGFPVCEGGFFEHPGVAHAGRCLGGAVGLEVGGTYKKNMWKIKSMDIEPKKKNVVSARHSWS